MKKQMTSWSLLILGLVTVTIGQVTMNGGVLVDILMDLNMARYQVLLACQQMQISEVKVTFTPYSSNMF